MSLNLRRLAYVLLGFACVVGFVGGSTLGAILLRTSPYLTRAEAVTIILLARPGPSEQVSSVHPYKDILPHDWFRDSMLRAAKLRMISADEAGTKLQPFGPVSRAAFLKMFAVAFALPLSQPHSFKDVPVGSWFVPYAGLESQYGLFSHVDLLELEPDRLLTQDEAKTALQTFLDLRSKEQEEEARKIRVNEFDGKTQLFTVTSTKRLKVVFVPESRPHLAAPTLKEIEAEAAKRILERKPILIVSKTTGDVRREILILTNDARKEYGLTALTMHGDLEESAQAYAEQMALEDFFGHTDPSGKTLQSRVEATDYISRAQSPDCQCIKGFSLGENLARGQRTAEEVFKAWMDSPSHKAAILGSDYTDIGIGIHGGIWVQHFGGELTPDR